MGDIDDDRNKAGSGPVGRISGDTKVVVDGRIKEALTRAGIGNAEDMFAVWGSEG